VSFDLLEVHRLKAAGGAVWDEYQRLVAECDAAMYDSPAHRALGEFQQAWEQNPAAVMAAAEQRAKAKARAS
jgi:hypothetical protein